MWGSFQRYRSKDIVRLNVSGFPMALPVKTQQMICKGMIDLNASNHRKRLSRKKKKEYLNRWLLISGVFFNFRSANFTIIWLKSPLSKTINRKWHFLRLIVWKRLLPRLIIVETYSSPKKVQAQLFSERPPLRPKIQNSVFLRTWLLRQYVSHIWSFSGSSSQWTSFLSKSLFTN